MVKKIRINFLDEVPDDYTGIVESDSGNRYWFKDGKLHRKNDPAAVYVTGERRWYQNGKKHCLSRPAVIAANGDNVWYQNGKKHRLDGPAVEFNNRKEYWIDDVRYSEEKFDKKTKLVQQQLSKRNTEYRHLSDEQWYGYLNTLVIE